eukprot:TRINITY_DN19419_c0_g1_i1.p1 TRINITY_DN19419_c0_g1~~TRINITY_DN19419_c0_g1_i1.p1  ORF type:complete len:229 (+),score=55.68 TRINITY_DN19419_c0_g1_i1:61-747(+)
MSERWQKGRRSGPLRRSGRAAAGRVLQQRRGVPDVAGGLALAAALEGTLGVDAARDLAGLAGGRALSPAVVEGERLAVPAGWDCGGLCAPAMEWEAAGVGQRSRESVALLVAARQGHPGAAPADVAERVARQRLVSAGTVRADWRRAVAVGRQGGLGREEEEALAWALLPPADAARRMRDAERALGLDLGAGRVALKPLVQELGWAGDAAYERLKGYAVLRARGFPFP